MYRGDVANSYNTTKDADQLVLAILAFKLSVIISAFHFHVGNTNFTIFNFLTFLPLYIRYIKLKIVMSKWESQLIVNEQFVDEVQLLCIST